MSRKRAYHVTKPFIAQVAAYVRAGCYPEVAAEVAGVPADVFRDWLHRSERKGRSLLLGDLREAVRTAAAQARAAAENELFRADRTLWLRIGPAKETPTRPGWSQPSKPVYQEEAPPVFPKELLSLLGDVFEVLQENPEMHQKVVQSLEEHDVPLP